MAEKKVTSYRLNEDVLAMLDELVDHFSFMTIGSVSRSAVVSEAIKEMHESYLGGVDSLRLSTVPDKRSAEDKELTD